MQRPNVAKLRGYFAVALIVLLLVGLYAFRSRALAGASSIATRSTSAGTLARESDFQSSSVPGPSNREQPQGALPQPAWIEVADEESLASLQPQSLWLQTLADDPAEPCSLEAGQHLSPGQIAPSQVRARVPGYVPFFGRFTPRPGANVLLMKRAGDLEVRIVDAAGRPVEDCAVELLLDQREEEWWSTGRRDSIFPTSSGDKSTSSLELVHTSSGWTSWMAGAADSTGLRSHDDWDAPVRRTSADGRAVWTDLPACDGYRWFVRQLHHVRYDPANERSRLDQRVDHVRASFSPPPAVSGRFRIAAGSTLQLTGTLLAAARVHGRVHCPSAKAAATVWLYSVGRAGGNPGPQVVAFDEARSQVVGADGAFEFSDLRPGDWAVRAWWQEAEHDYYFTCATFQLEPGADLDLGVLGPLAGESLEIAIGIADQNREPQAPQVMYEDTGVPLDAYLAITAIPDSGLATHMVSGYFPVPFETIFRLHGLQPGRVYLSAEPSPKLSVDPARVASIFGVEADDFEVGSTDFVYLELVARVGTARPLLLRNERGHEILAPAVWVRESASDRVFSVRPHRLKTGGQALNLPGGAYEVLCKFTTADHPQGLSARATVTFGGADRGPIELDAQPAVSISGVLRDGSGAAVPYHAIAWGLDGWSLSAHEAVFGTRTDSRGAFTLNEVPAHTPLRSSTRGCDLPALPPGTHGELVLTSAP